MAGTKAKVGVSEAIDAIGFGNYQIFIASAVGCAWVADSMEMMILSILSPALRCYDWKITKNHEALLTTLVFLGSFLGAPSFGLVADKYGRRPTLMIGTFFLLFYGLLSAGSPTYEWMLTLRFFVGVYLGSIPQSCTLMVEFLPTSSRGKSVLFLALFWAAGSTFVALLAWIVMPTMGWRALIVICTLPLLCFMITTPWFPESPLYLSQLGQQEKALHELQKVARINGKQDFFDNHQLELDEAGVCRRDRGSFKDLFEAGRAKLSVLVGIMWLANAACYYGIVLIATSLLNSGEDICGSHGNSREKEVETCSVSKCEGLQPADYLDLIWTSVAEFPGCVFAIFIIDRLGRKKTLLLLFAIFSVSVGFMSICWLRGWLTVAIIVARAAISGSFQVLFVYTPEVYPTYLRAVAFGSASSLGRVGAMITPFIAQVLVVKSLYLAIGIYVAFGIIACITSQLLPVESVGADLSETGYQVTKGRARLVEK